MTKDYKSIEHRIKSEFLRNWDVALIAIVLVVLAVALLKIFYSPTNQESIYKENTHQENGKSQVEESKIQTIPPNATATSSEGQAQDLEKRQQIINGEDKVDQLDEQLEDIRQKIRDERQLKGIERF